MYAVTTWSHAERSDDMRTFVMGPDTRFELVTHLGVAIATVNRDVLKKPCVNYYSFWFWNQDVALIIKRGKQFGFTADLSGNMKEALVTLKSSWSRSRGARVLSGNFLGVRSQRARATQQMPLRARNKPLIPGLAEGNYTLCSGLSDASHRGSVGRPITSHHGSCSCPGLHISSESLGTRAPAAEVSHGTAARAGLPGVGWMRLRSSLLCDGTRLKDRLKRHATQEKGKYCTASFIAEVERV